MFTRPFRSALIAATILGTPVVAQDAETGNAGPVLTRDDAYLRSLDDAKIANNDGDIIGEIEEVLINSKGVPAGFLVELENGFFDFGDDNVSIPLESLTWSNGHYVSKMTKEQLEKLRPWDE